MLAHPELAQEPVWGQEPGGRQAVELELVAVPELVELAPELVELVVEQVELVAERIAGTVAELGLAVGSGEEPG